MTAKDFVNNYVMHDSLIDNVEILYGGDTVVLWVDFAFWMQKGYNEADPETGMLKVTFSGVSKCIIPEDVNWNEISILETCIDNGNIKFSLMNDMTDAYLEIIISSDNVTVESIFED